MALHDSPLADAALRALALRALCSAAAAPELAADLVQRAGTPLNLGAQIWQTIWRVHET